MSRLIILGLLIIVTVLDISQAKYYLLETEGDGEGGSPEMMADSWRRKENEIDMEDLFGEVSEVDDILVNANRLDDSMEGSSKVERKWRKRKSGYARRKSGGMDYQHPEDLGSGFDESWSGFKG